MSWFPAVLRLAKDRGWRVLNLTMSACGPASINSYSTAVHAVMRSCLTWRSQAIARLVRLRPAIILVSGTRGFAVADSAGRVLTGRARTNAWVRGMNLTLARLVPAAGRVILLADTPNSTLARPASCLARHPNHARRCATAVAQAISYAWLNTEFGVAKSRKAGFIDPELWVCPTSPCPEVISGRLVHRNPGHLTVMFATAQWWRLEQAVLRERARRTTIVRR